MQPPLRVYLLTRQRLRGKLKWTRSSSPLSVGQRILCVHAHNIWCLHAELACSLHREVPALPTASARLPPPLVLGLSSGFGARWAHVASSHCGAAVP